MDDRLLDRLPDLRVISKYGVGLDLIDMDAIASRNIVLASAADEFTGRCRDGDF